MTTSAYQAGWSRGLFIALLLLCSLMGGEALAAKAPKPIILRVGYFPNVTHAQALVARNFTRQGKGWFEGRLGPNVEIRWFSYNAGPSAMEAMLAHSLDLSYVGPNPSLNAYMRSKGREVRIIAGSAQGGAGLVVQKEIRQPADLRGRKIATPQFGNTQDVACRVWLEQQGFKVTLRGGDVQVVPTPNPDQLDLFLRGDVAGVWTVEPWLSRLEFEAKGKVFLLETNAVTTLLTARTGFLSEQRELAKKFRAAHTELTAWINAHPREAREMARAELAAQMRREIPEKLVQLSWSRLHFKTDIPEKELETLVAEAQKAGFLKETIPLRGLIEIP